MRYRRNSIQDYPASKGKMVHTVSSTGIQKVGGLFGAKPLLAPASGYGDISLWLVKPGLAAQESRVEPGLLDFHGFQNQWDVWVTVYYMNSADLRKPRPTPESY